MGILIRIWKTMPLPPGATVKKDTVTWMAKGKKRTGKLTGKNRVSIQSNTWTAQFTDETGKVQRVSTKTKNRSAAEKILARHEADGFVIMEITSESRDSLKRTGRCPDFTIFCLQCHDISPLVRHHTIEKVSIIFIFFSIFLPFLFQVNCDV
jgi:hypothetical protein